MEIAVLKAVCGELAGELPGMKVVELAEGEAGEVCLSFRGKGCKRVLLISPRPDNPRIYLTGPDPCRSKRLTPFAQSLRNHIIGATMTSTAQEGLERVVIFNFTRKGKGAPEKAAVIKAALIFELAGKKPNLLLVDEAGKVALAQSCVPLSESALRPILPGLSYQPPPRPYRLDPHMLTTEDVGRLLRDNPAIKPDKALMQGIGGISPVMAREAVALAGTPLDARKLLHTLSALIKKVEDGPYEPRVYETPKGPVLSALALKQFEGFPVTAFDSMSKAAESYYDTLAERRRYEVARASAIKKAAARLTSAIRKLAAIEDDSSRADKADTYQTYGQLLMASQGEAKAGEAYIELPDLFAGVGTARVPVDPKLSRVGNAESYFRKAKKARAGAVILMGRLAASKVEVGGLRALLERVEKAKDLVGLQGLSEAPTPKSRKAKGPRKAGAAMPEFPRFVSSDGYEVFYAKNAKLNDILTFKFAEPMDLWLHAQGYHGAHVIVRNPDKRPDIPLNTILEAAEVAAYFSEARDDSSVPVDYTSKKHVRKPKDPAPGQAIFTHNKTVFVGPKKR